MIRSLISNDAKLTKALVRILNLELITENALGSFYKKGGWILVLGQESEKIREFLITEFAIDSAYYIRLGRSIDTEHEIGDVILPNTFFVCDDTICKKEVTEQNCNDFIKNPQFLEIFDEQKDYYIEDFGLSIGGIAVSKTPKTKENIDASLMMAYAGDIYFTDDISHLIPLTNHDTVGTVILGSIIDGKKPSGLSDPYARAASNITTTIKLLEKEN
ncbi:hypothetical protein CSB09_01425 [Candidatus Gracilibacteria bacterium]|nr:MAG: hypothetical protein CSB09_01425 [Candidatus Gracilibacteria bacterium]